MNWIKENWKVVAGLVGTGVLILAILALVAGIKDCSFNSGMNKSNKELQNLNAQATNINTVVANLEQKQFEAEVNANLANAELEKRREEVNTAREISNQALENVNKVANANYNGTTLTEAEKARCRAFYHPGCPE